MWSVSACLSVSVSVPWAFSWALFLIYVLSYSDWFGFVFSYILLLTLRYLFSKES